ncbi:MAG: hypothetical protein LLF95_07760 [Bacteroidales bacterium]|nr:hypothetical protein [Bacteroidales bacterium]
MSTQNKELECCPPFDPTPWDDQIFSWDQKPFIKDKVFTMFYMPVNFGSVMTRMNKLVEKANTQIPDWLCLSDHTSKWNMDLYLAVEKAIPGAENVLLNGTFYSRVYGR